MDDAWIGTAEAARLGVTRATVLRFIDRGDLPAYRMGRVIRVRVADLEAFRRGVPDRTGTLGDGPP